MEYRLTRFASAAESTLGLLHRIAGSSQVFACFTLEDQYQSKKIAGETRIPGGRYQIKVRTDGTLNGKYLVKYGEIHKGMLWLQNVPGFEWVYIHVGNKDDDTEGCILVGDGIQSNVGGDGMIMASTMAYMRLYLEMLGYINSPEGCWITVVD